MTSERAITDVFAWQALDSRGTPTVAAEITLAGGARGSAIVPSGASTGTHEARELRDGGTRYGGRGVANAVANANEDLASAILGLDASEQSRVDESLRQASGDDSLALLGANAVLALSIAAAQAAAAAGGQPLYAAVARPGTRPLLPLPMVNIISGGAHAGRSIDVQDFLVVPLSASSFSEAIEVAWNVRAATARVLEDGGHSVALIADEGGLGPVMPTNRAALEAVSRGIERAGYALGEDVGIAIDIAATQFYSPERGDYRLAAEDRDISAAGLISELQEWAGSFPIVSMEDVLAEDDWEGWVLATEALSGIQLLGDDLFCTNKQRVAKGIQLGAANAVLVKPNQIGTLTDAREVVDFAHSAGMATILSARSGETEDSWLSDLAVGWGTGQIKVGSTMRSERTSKWNRLLAIEARLRDGADYAGRDALAANSDAPARP